MMKGSHKKPILSLYRKFEPGDRVKRTIENENGRKQEIEGIVMAMDHNRLEVYWDTMDGIYCPNDIMEDFTMCDFEEVMYGTHIYSPVRQKKSILI
jgi:hypothetical protein